MISLPLEDAERCRRDGGKMIFNPSSISDILSFFYGMEGEFTTFFFTSKVSRNLFYDGDEGRGCWGSFN